jgi:undecaprenyl-diphosphatase
MLLLPLLFLAIVQGLTEFIPVSSSAHLILVPVFLGIEDQGRAIDVAAHVGSLGAVMLYFRGETGALFRGGIDTLRFHDSADRRLFLAIAVATVPIVLFGLVLALTGIADHLRDPRVIATTSIVFGIVLYLADRRPVRLTHMPERWGPILTIGAAQALAVIPGTSRSGITITAARALGFDRETAARFSMLLAIPAIAASGTYEAVRLVEEGAAAAWGPILVVAVASFLAAWAAIGLFLKMTRHMSFTPFVIYRIALGVLLFAIFS